MMLVPSNDLFLLLDPCAGVTCGLGFTKTEKIGQCYCLCGTVDCDPNVANRCNDNTCVCGDGDATTACDPTSTIPRCLTAALGLDADAFTATPADDAACRVSNFVLTPFFYFNPICYRILEFNQNIFFHH